MAEIQELKLILAAKNDEIDMLRGEIDMLRGENKRLDDR